MSAPDFYEHVQKARPAKRRVHVWVLAGAFLLAVFLPLGWMLHTYAQARADYHSFLTALNAATLRNYRDTASLPISGGDETWTLQGDDVYLPYIRLSNGGMGRPDRRVPKDAPSLLFDYGRGATLQVFSVPLDAGAAQDSGLLVRFVGPQGATYSYVTDYFTFEQFRALCR